MGWHGRVRQDLSSILVQDRQDSRPNGKLARIGFLLRMCNNDEDLFNSSRSKSGGRFDCLVPAKKLARNQI